MASSDKQLYTHHVSAPNGMQMGLLWLSITTGTTPFDICAFCETLKASEQFLTGNFCWSICVMDIPKNAQLS